MVLPFFTNLPTDVITNTLYFAADEALTLPAAAALIDVNLATFYTTVYTTGHALADYVAPAQARVNYYNMGDPPPRVPVTLPFIPTLVPQVASTIPTEVALVVSFEGGPLSGTPQARRRGRIFLGALTPQFMTASTTGQFPRFASAFVTSIAAAAEQLREDSDTDACPWVVHSPTTGLNTPVVRGWVDNGPDTQRRRSVLANQRTLWP